MGPSKGSQVRRRLPAVMAPRHRCGTIVHLTWGILVGRMRPIVHFVIIARGRDRDGSVFTPGEPRVDSEDRAACSVCFKPQFHCGLDRIGSR